MFSVLDRTSSLPFKTIPLNLFQVCNLEQKRAPLKRGCYCEQSMTFGRRGNLPKKMMGSVPTGDRRGRKSLPRDDKLVVLVGWVANPFITVPG